MGKNSKISWTDHTYNPWWGCTKVSPGCANCYASTFSHRLGFDVWGDDKPRRFFSEKHRREPLRWNARCEKEGIRQRVFSGSMCDVFEDRSDLAEPRHDLFKLIEETPRLDWLLCTKRVCNVMSMVPRAWQWGFPKNVWMLFTAENQQMYYKRSTEARLWPCRFTGVSIEPMLGPIDLDCGLRPFDWMIYGCESGANRRPCPMEWIEDGLQQCREHNIPAFVKQIDLGDTISKEMLPEVWPDWACVQEFPNTYPEDLLIKE